MYDKLIKNSDSYFRKLIGTGWMDDWVEDDMDILKEALDKTAAESPEYMVHCLSEYSLEIDGICTPEDYVDTCYKLLKAFDINISISDINAEADGTKITLAFNTPEGLAEWTFEQDSDWMHDDTLDFLNDEVLLPYGEERVFHPLPPDSSNIQLVFQFPEIIDKAYEDGVIPDDDYFMNI